MYSIIVRALALWTVWVGSTGVALASAPTPVPEPGSLSLVGIAVAGLVAIARRHKK